MHIWFRKLGQTEYVDMVAEDRTQSEEHPRTFLVSEKTFKKLDDVPKNARFNAEDIHTVFFRW